MLTSISFEASTGLSGVLRSQGRSKAAVMLSERVYEIALHSVHPRHEVLLSHECELAYSLCEAGQYSKSEALTKDVLQKISPMLAPDNVYILSCLRNLAVVKERLGELDESEKIHRQVLLARSYLWVENTRVF